MLNKRIQCKSQRAAMFGLDAHIKNPVILNLIQNPCFANLKKAAMFGLDARIALAIFGALSVITGAALYSAISNAKATAVLAQMNEVGKAVEQYYLDTGVLPVKKSDDNTTDDFYILYSGHLVNNLNDVKGWQGPYLSYETESITLKHPKYSHIQLLTLTDDVAWGDDIAWQTGGKCISGKKCHLSIMINGIMNGESLAIAIDKKVDGGDGAAKGKFKWWETGDNYRFHLNYMPMKNPND